MSKRESSEPQDFEDEARVASDVNKTTRRSFLKRGLLLILVALGALSGIYGYLATTIKPEAEKRPTGPVIRLQSPKTTGTMPVEEALAKRRSIRKYTGKPLTLEEVSQLMWAAQGITLREWGFRTAPSAGGTYPLEVYMVVKRDGVDGLEAGVYHYDPKEHTLVRVASGDFSEELMAAAVDQLWVAEAAINLVITAIFHRTTDRYGARGEHYVWQESGHVGQNIYLQAMTLKLGTVVIGAFHDEQVQRIVAVPEEERPLYVIPVGNLK